MPHHLEVVLDFAFGFLPRLIPFLFGSSFSSRLIGEPLADHTAQQFFSAFVVLDSKRLAIVVAEIELGHVTVKMVVRAVLIDAFHAALEDREKTFDGVGVDGRVNLGNVFALAVPGKGVTSKVFVDVFVLPGLVGHDVRLAGDVSLKDRNQGLRFQIINDHTTRLAGSTIYQGQNLIFVLVAAPFLLALRLLGEIAANEGFIDFHDAAIGTERRKVARAHRFTNAMGHEPSRFEGDAQGAMQLIRADALLAGCNQENSLQPKAHWDVAGLENGADFYGKRLAAVVAFVRAYAGTCAAHFADALNATAMRAYRAARPYTGLYVGVRGLFIVEVRLGKIGFAHDSSPLLT